MKKQEELKSLFDAALGVGRQEKSLDILLPRFDLCGLFMAY